MMPGWNYSRRLLPIIRVPAKIAPPPRVKRVLRVGVVVVAFLGLLTSVWLFLRTPQKALGNEPVDDGSRITGPDAHIIARSQSWSIAKAKDFGSSFASLLGASEKELVGKTSIAWSNTSVSGNLYVLTANSRQLRVVLVYEGKVLLDRAGRQIQGAVRVPHEALASVEWKRDADPKVPADGDGVLVLLKDGSEMLPQIAFASGGSTYIGVPADVSKVDLRKASASRQP